MSYFAEFPMTRYQYGNETYSVLTQNLAAYVDVIDDIKDAISFYTEMYILDGDRPDNMSYKLYGTPEYYFTFFLMNDHLRQQGWPLTQKALDEKVKTDYPHFTITNNSGNGDAQLKVGSNITGNTSGATGTIIKRRLDLGQLIVKPTNDFTFRKGELVAIFDEFGFVTKSVVATAATDQWQSVRHYVDGNGERVDIDPLNTDNIPAQYTPVLYNEWYKERNDANREMKVIKPTAIQSVMRAFRDAMKSA